MTPDKYCKDYFKFVKWAKDNGYQLNLTGNEADFINAILDGKSVIDYIKNVGNLDVSFSMVNKYIQQTQR